MIARRAHLEALGDVNLDLLVSGALEDLAQHDVRDLLDLRLGQLAEHDDLVLQARQNNVSLISLSALATIETYWVVDVVCKHVAACRLLSVQASPGHTGSEFPRSKNYQA